MDRIDFGRSQVGAPILAAIKVLLENLSCETKGNLSREVAGYYAERMLTQRLPQLIDVSVSDKKLKSLPGSEIQLTCLVLLKDCFLRNASLMRPDQNGLGWIDDLFANVASELKLPQPDALNSNELLDIMDLKADWAKDLSKRIGFSSTKLIALHGAIVKGPAELNSYPREYYCELPSDPESLKVLVKAAEDEDRLSQAKLSLMYMNGTVVEQDVGQAFQLIRAASEDTLALLAAYRSAADQEDAGAHYGLHEIWEKGLGITKNLAIANEHLTAAAEAGFPFAQQMMGLSLKCDYRGFQEDYPAAERWLLRAADNGMLTAHIHLFNLYDRGPTEMLDSKKAFFHLSLGIMDGWAADFWSMAKLYEEGRGVARSLVMAGCYYYLYECQQDERPESDLHRICEQLTEEERIEVKQLALAWIDERSPKASRFDAFGRGLSNPL
ncbi:MAG: tetratricopeptide repeat protein, partial [Planctomycetota bacterium]